MSVVEFVRLLASNDESRTCPSILLPIVRPADSNWTEVAVKDHWRSIDEVTGPTIWVACPSDGEHETITIFDTLYSYALGSNSSEVRLGEGDERRIVARFRRQAPPPYERESMTWGAEAANIANAFGLTESMLPCLLFIDLVNRSILAIAMPAGHSVYAVCKRVIQELGPAEPRYRIALDDLRRHEHDHRRAEYALDNARRSVESRDTLLADSLQRCRSLAEELRLSILEDSSGRICTVAAAIEHHLATHTLTEELPHLLNETRQRLLLIHNADTQSLNRRIKRTAKRLTQCLNDNTTSSLEDVATLEAAFSAQQSRTGTAKQALVAAMKQVNISDAAAGVAREMFGKVNRKELNVSVAGMGGAWLGPNRESLHHPIVNLPTERQVARLAGAYALATTLLGSAVAIFINYATSEIGGWTFWAVALSLTTILAAIAYTSAKHDRT